MLKFDVDLADPLIILPELVNTIHGLEKYSLIFDARIPIIPSCMLAS